MGFRDLRKEIYYRCHLDPDGFAESITYFTSGNEVGQETVVTVLRRVEYEMAQYGNRNREALRVSISKDPASEVGGIANPQRGDSLILSSRPGEDKKPRFTFDRIDRDTDHSWILEFSRETTLTAGGATRQ